MKLIFQILLYILSTISGFTLYAQYFWLRVIMSDINKKLNTEAIHSFSFYGMMG